MSGHRTITLADVPSIPDMSITEDMLGLNGAGEPDSWHPIDLADLEDRPPIQPTLGGLGICYPGKRHVFSGPQESAKTLAAYMVALHVVRDHGTAVIVDFEMGRWDARDRLRDLGATQHELHQLHYIEPHEPATAQRIEILTLLEPQLVIIDAAAGAYDIQGLDDNKRGDVERFTTIYVRAFWQAGIATIVLDHVVKNADNRGGYAIGSERKIGGADVHLGFTTVMPVRRGGTGIYKITTHKDRGGYLQRGHLADLHLISDPNTNAIGWEFRATEHHAGDEPWRPTVLMERASDYLATCPEAVPINDVVTNVKGRDATLRQAHEHLQALGHVAVENGARGAHNVHLITPYKAPRPTSADLGPAEVTPPRPTSAPPSRGADGAAGVVAAENETTSARPAEQEPLYGNYDADIPF